ncbi:MAG: PA0069 family radical SAM protein [Pirellulales bacterium]|nr:PA0069 family radical SAM protein [Pirellulales bacterium]
MAKPPRNFVGRGSQVRPDNRFERDRLEASESQEEAVADESAAAVDVCGDERRRLPTQFFADESQSILASNDSPDVGFRWSVNPYRGCEHGCAYCYARPTHEYLGFDSGLDFETRIMVKHRAPELLRAALARPAWRGELIAFSGVTDCYQPAEREYRLTRACLQICAESRQCLTIVTKNALVTRDIDILAPLASERVADVNISLTTLDANLARRLEPRTSPPVKRLEAIGQLAAAGIAVRALLAPIIPGLNDEEIPAILAAARDAGATAASYVLLRLPHGVRPIFLDWLERNVPDKRPRIEARIRDTRAGNLTDSQFGRRHRGQGFYADQIAATFRVFSQKLRLDRGMSALDESRFTPPSTGGQLRLF